MAFIHGHGAVVSLDGDDMSAFGTQVAFKLSADSHDVTTFGKTWHVFQGGLLTGEATLTGVYDDGATGPETTIIPLLGTTVEMVYKPEGAVGAGKPIRTVDVVVTAYEETTPVADMITWTATCQLTDTMVATSVGA